MFSFLESWSLFDLHRIFQIFDISISDLIFKSSAVWNASLVFEKLVFVNRNEGRGTFIILFKFFKFNFAPDLFIISNTNFSYLGKLRWEASFSWQRVLFHVVWLFQFIYISFRNAWDLVMSYALLDQQLNHPSYSCSMLRPKVWPM